MDLHDCIRTLVLKLRRRHLLAIAVDGNDLIRQMRRRLAIVRHTCKHGSHIFFRQGTRKCRYHRWRLGRSTASLGSITLFRSVLHGSIVIATSSRISSRKQLFLLLGLASSILACALANNLGGTLRIDMEKSKFQVLVSTARNLRSKQKQ
jgi:hypothetical protein